MNDREGFPLEISQPKTLTKKQKQDSLPDPPAVLNDDLYVKFQTNIPGQQSNRRLFFVSKSIRQPIFVDEATCTRY